MVFTADLRVHDHPALSAALAEHERVVPAFVFDDEILAGPFNAPNRAGFLLEALTDLDRSLGRLGSPLVVRRGDWVDEILRLAATCEASAIHVSEGVTKFARRRLQRLESAAGRNRVGVQQHAGLCVVAPGSLTPPGGDHYQVFTPYYRRWIGTAWRPPCPTPERVPTVALAAGTLPRLSDIARGSSSPGVPPGGEGAGRRLLTEWRARGLASYAGARDRLDQDGTSRLSAYLHFGCLSPTEVAAAARSEPDAEPFVRQLCWRDFLLQVLAARPDTGWRDYRPGRHGRWREDPDGLEAWRRGRTGYPVVDAAMRQLLAEGFVHNRARMIAASFLTKDLSIDWREGARHFLHHLVDGDIANNNLNWQWVAGTGTDTNPHRMFNPTLQGRRYDPDGDYVRRYVPELRSIPGAAVHDPGPLERRRAGYPSPVVDHPAAARRYRAAIGR